MIILSHFHILKQHQKIIPEKKRKQETIEKAVNLGKRLPDREGQLKVIAGILTFTDKIIDQAYAKKLEEEMQMTLVGQMLMEEGYQRGKEKGIQVFIQDNVSENIPKQRIIQKLQANFSLMEENAINYYTIFQSRHKTNIQSIKRAVSSMTFHR